MYYITDKHEAIRTVQRFLGQNQTGVYGADTRDAVAEHQVKRNIRKSGVVDYDTFNSLKSDYLAQDAGFTLFSKFPYKRGDMGTDVTVINAIIAEVISEYEFDGTVSEVGYFGDTTADAVLRLREIFGLGYSDKIDKNFMKRLLMEKNAINLSKSNR